VASLTPAVEASLLSLRIPRQRALSALKRNVAQGSCQKCRPQNTGQGFDLYLAERAKVDLADTANQTHADAAHRCLTGSFDLDRDDQDGKDLMRRLDETDLQPLIACMKVQAYH
jgi:hypothetical protein